MMDYLESLWGFAKFVLACLGYLVVMFFVVFGVLGLGLFSLWFLFKLI